MFAVFSDGTEVIVCAVDDDGKPITKDYFFGDGRNAEDYDHALVEPPVHIKRGSVIVEPEKILTGSI